MLYLPYSRIGKLKFLDNSRHDKKLPVEPDIQYQQVFTIDTIIPYKEYNVDASPQNLNIRPLTIEQGKRFGKLLAEFTNLFVQDIANLGQTDLVTHRIYTKE